ncbi:hypothetical protein HUU59_07625 [bacterium]|nr:hypothetical protein [bacterium]
MNETRTTFWLRVMYGAILVVALLYTVAPQWGEQADIWETSAAIDAISRSPLEPDNPLLALEGETSPRFTPYTVFWGIVDRAAGLDLFVTVAIAGLLNLVLFLTGLVRVVRTITLSPAAILWIISAMLIGWGHGYGEANGYQAELFYATLPYVGMFTYGLCFHGIAELNRFLSTGSKAALLGYGLLGITAFLTHPITALLLFVGAFSWTVVRSSFKTTLLLQVVPAIAFLSCWLWPYFDYPTLLFRGTAEDWYRVRLFDDQITKAGPALLGILAASYFAAKRKYLAPVTALGLSLVIYLASWILGIQIGSRFIFYGAIFSHVCIGLYLFDSGLFRRGFFERGKSVVIPAILLFTLVYLPGSYYRIRKMDKQWRPDVEVIAATGALPQPWDDLAFLKQYLGSSSVVMVEDTAGWRVPAVTGAKLVAQAKGNPLIQDEVNSRRADAVKFFSGRLSLDERRQLLLKYKCTHILLDNRRGGHFADDLERHLAELGEFVTAHPPFRLYRVRNSD